MPLAPHCSLSIGAAAEASGVTAKMIRHYEDIGLIKHVRRTTAGYRLYAPDDVHVLSFIRQSRRLGFSMAEIGTLLGLWRDKKRPSRKVRELAQTHIDELNQKIQDLQAMKATLTRLVDCCHGDERPDCPILEELARNDVPKDGPKEVRKEVRKNMITTPAAKRKQKSTLHDGH